MTQEVPFNYLNSLLVAAQAENPNLNQLWRILRRSNAPCPPSARGSPQHPYQMPQLFIYAKVQLNSESSKQTANHLHAKAVVLSFWSWLSGHR